MPAETARSAYTRDWAAFARWGQLKGADPLPRARAGGLYITDLAAPSGRARALTVVSIERRLAGLAVGG